MNIAHAEAVKTKEIKELKETVQYQRKVMGLLEDKDVKTIRKQAKEDVKKLRERAIREERNIRKHSEKQLREIRETAQKAKTCNMCLFKIEVMAYNSNFKDSQP